MLVGRGRKIRSSECRNFFPTVRPLAGEREVEVGGLVGGVSRHYRHFPAVGRGESGGEHPSEGRLRRLALSSSTRADEEAVIAERPQFFAGEYVSSLADVAVFGVDCRQGVVAVYFKGFPITPARGVDMREVGVDELRHQKRNVHV